MNPMPGTTWIAFAKQKRIAFGEPKEVATRVKSFVDGHLEVPIVIFDANSSQPVELDLRGSLATVVKRLPALSSGASPASVSAIEGPPRGPGRPKLGVVAREVTLLPRHWDWLAAQPGGASVALRKLVERAQRASAESDRRREATESAYRFMHAMAGDEAGFEEASRALFAGDLERLQDEVATWPRDVRTHLLELAGRTASTSPADATQAPD
ncbi:DUF2239 family protein [Cupriavidus necator]|uniref:DUF2239 family protein n=1 Tax=Cupriavidus necator TaxID=106590 RepID=UPI0027D7F556|nr:DUF2239 family protein [Cupriavidus necator]